MPEQTKGTSAPQDAIPGDDGKRWDPAIEAGPFRVRARSSDGQEVRSKPLEVDVFAGWVEVRLVDEQGEPVPNRAFAVLQRGREPIRGVLDDEGRARVEKLRSGAAAVVFTEIDGAEWDDPGPEPAPPLRETAPAPVTPAPPAQATPAAAFEPLLICVRDDAGRGVPGLPFIAQLPDGTEREGALDIDGRAVLQDVPAGVAQVRFPTIDAADWDAPPPDAPVPARAAS